MHRRISSEQMIMGGACSSQRRRHHRRHQSNHPMDGNNHRQRRSRLRSTGRLRTRSFSSAVGRLCGAAVRTFADCLHHTFDARFPCSLRHLQCIVIIYTLLSRLVAVHSHLFGNAFFSYASMACVHIANANLLISLHPLNQLNANITCMLFFICTM